MTTRNQEKEIRTKDKNTASCVPIFPNYEEAFKLVRNKPEEFTELATAIYNLGSTGAETVFPEGSMLKAIYSLLRPNVLEARKKNLSNNRNRAVNSMMQKAERVFPIWPKETKRDICKQIYDEELTWEEAEEKYNNGELVAAAAETPDERTLSEEIAHQENQRIYAILDKLNFPVEKKARIMSEALSLKDEYGLDMFTQAVNEACKQGRGFDNLEYVKGILQNWK